MTQTDPQPHQLPPTPSPSTAAAPPPPPAAAGDPTTPAPIVLPSAQAAAQAPKPTPPPPPDPETLQPTQAIEEAAVEATTPAWLVVLKFLMSWVVVPGLLVLFVHNFVFQAWYVDGQSMHPTFENGDYLIVSKWDVSLKRLMGQSSKLDINRGDVVIFNPPDYTGDIYFIKRAIGLPGERVVIKDGVVTIFNKSNLNGLILNESYIGGVALEGDIDQIVPEGEVFLIGDNRQPGASHDSRAIGPIPQDHVVGTASIRLLPVSQFGGVAHPVYE